MNKKSRRILRAAFLAGTSLALLAINATAVFAGGKWP